jgi:Tol biopolymer transport system component
MKSRNLTCLAAIMFAVLEISIQLAFCDSAGTADNPGRIAFLMGPDVYSMRPDGSEVKQLTTLGSQNIIATYQSWSFDGKQIVFVQIPPNAPAQLWLMNYDGTNQHQVFSDGNFQDWAPSFAPDGKRLIFTRCQPTWPAPLTSCAIYRVNIDGTGLQAITHFSPVVNEWEANYSPDGKTISFEAFELEGILAAVYFMNPDGTSRHRITNPAPCAIDSNWSPTGTKIAVWTRECNPQTNQIWMMNPDGNDIRRLTNTQLPIANFNPTWSPDGSRIAFERDNFSKGTSAIFVINADGNEPRQILEIPVPTDRSSLGRGIAGRKAAAQHFPKQIEQGGFFPKWGLPPR